MKKFINSLKSFFNNRIAVLIAVLIILFSILVVHLFNLQIIKGNEYKKSLNSSIEKVISTQASRGRIFDRNGVLLAYDDIVYAVNISDTGSYKNKTEKNESINNSIIKNKYTKEQKKLSKEQRILNIKGAFSIKRKSNLYGKDIILIDDVTTTGATLTECRKVLKKYGVNKIICLTIAKSNI